MFQLTADSRVTLGESCPSWRHREVEEGEES